MQRILLLIMMATSLISCGNKGSKKQATLEPSQSDVTEVLYFHGKQRCITCNAIEKLTREVIDSLASEKVIMNVIDISKEENEAIADKYEVTWSSLILNHKDTIENLTEMGFTYAKGQPEVFKAKLVEAIGNITK